MVWRSWSPLSTMFTVQRVTLCLLITYHWHASAGSPNVSVPSTTVRIAGEVNGSPTDARLNIPVVKRSSNQAGFANELRPVPVPTTLFELPHEYANRNEEKYSRGIREPIGKARDAEPPLDTGIFKRERRERDENVSKEKEEEEEEAEEEEEEEVEEKGNAGRRMKSSIPAEETTTAAESGLIGEAYSSPLASIRERRFDYERASASRIRQKRDEGSRGVEERKKERARAVDEEESDSGEIVVGSFISSDAPNFEVGRISDDPEESQAREGRYSLLLDAAERIRKKGNEDDGAGGLSDRSSSSLKPADQPSSEASRSGNAPASATSGETNKIFDSKRSRQQSRNTKPWTVARHPRRDTKGRTLSCDDPIYGRSAGLRGRTSEDEPSKRTVRDDDGDRRRSGGPQLRFIPADSRRSHPVDSDVYFGGKARRAFIGGGSAASDKDASAFYPNGQTNPRAIVKLPRFDAAQIESLKGVFDRYDVDGHGRRNELTNVRTIGAEQIFVAPPRLVYDTKILPAPFSFPSYFRSAGSEFDERNNKHDEGSGKKIVEHGFEVSGVFDRGNRNELDNREAIPVIENSEPSLTDALNFVTPSPSYRYSEGANGEVSIPVNHAPEDSTEFEEIYRVSGGDIEIGGKETGETKRQRVEGYEDSRMNQESAIDAGTVQHRGPGGSSYDNSVSTFGSADESGSGDVDHSAVIGGIPDEYVNREPPSQGSYTPADRARAQSVGKSNDETYDRDYYEWRGKYDNENDRYAAKYSFDYRVSDRETRNNFGHRETRDDGVTMGKYHVRLPDGRIQEVDYNVDDKGYHARVSYHLDNGERTHLRSQSQPRTGM